MKRLWFKIYGDISNPDFNVKERKISAQRLGDISKLNYWVEKGKASEQPKGHMNKNNKGKIYQQN